MNLERLVIGTAQFGLNYGINNKSGKVTDEEIKNILDYAYNLGVRKLDTADGYGDALEAIGRYLTSSNKNIKIMGKFSFIDEFSLKNRYIKTIARLGVDKIDTYYFHRFEDFLNFKKISDINNLISDKCIEKIGVSIYTNEQLTIAIHTDWIDVIQVPYNLFDSDIHKVEMLKIAKEKGKEVYIRSVYLQGLFFKPQGSFPLKIKELEGAVLKLKEVAFENNMSVAEMAMSYCFSRDYIDGVIVGVDSLEQLKESIQATRCVISEELITVIQKIKIKNRHLLNPATWI